MTDNAAQAWTADSGDTTIDDGRATLFYMIDPPNLVTPAIPLLLSIRRFHPKAKVIAYVPQGKMGMISDRLRAFHADHDAQMVELSQPLAFNRRRYNKAYVHGHKLLAVAETRDTDFGIFLDTDTYLAGPLDDPRLFQKDRIAAVPESVAGYAKRFIEIWDATYAVFGMTTPVERVNMLRSGREHPPYFNAGFVAFPEVLPDGQRFGELWLQTALTLDFDDTTNDEDKRPWLDQASLPVTVYRAGCRFEELPPLFNYPIDSTFPPRPDVRLYHYHGVERLQEANHLGEMADLILHSGYFTSMDHYLSPMNARREAMIEISKKVAAEAQLRRDLKTVIAEGTEQQERVAAKQTSARSKQAEMKLRDEMAQIVEENFYDDDWLRRR